MNEIVTNNKQLPDTIPELAKFVLIGRDKLKAVRAEIHAIDKVGMAREVYNQKLEEAQAIAEVVTDAECRMGELLKAVPKASGGDRRSESFKISPHVDYEKPKSEVVKESGLTQRQAEQFQIMANHPESVEKAKEKAREQGTVLSRNAVIQQIEADTTNKTPHVVNNTGDNEWYTPAEYIEAAREVMGSIDLDPASNDFANQTVKAGTYYTAETNGLDKEWFGNIWMNPPYSTALIKQFAEKLAQSDFEQAIILVNNATETGWFLQMIKKASAIVFPTGRIRFEKTDRTGNSPLQGQAFIYCGNNREKFFDVFGKYGWCATL